MAHLRLRFRKIANVAKKASDGRAQHVQHAQAWQR
jgi:hypothetical protein